MRNPDWMQSIQKKMVCMHEKLGKSVLWQCAVLDDPEYQGLLLHGTGNKPAEEQVDVPLIYGDYFYLEALARLDGWRNKIF